ncbi:MAG: hypothetical protein MJA32_15290 [Proteobacteria bacterium]|nr:hypothetical protein [Pseudomonadota bacterium]
MESSALRLSTAILAVMAGPAFAHADSAVREGLAPLFADHAVLEATIRAPLTTLMDVRPDEDYLDGTFAYKKADGTRKELAVRLRTRGNYRRDEEHCDFAPIRLNFKTRKVAASLFEGQDKLKLVTHCRTNDRRFEQLVAREYIVYRLLQELTSVSYAVRLFDVTYVDTESGEELNRLAFVIEDDEAVAKRNGLQAVKVERVAPEQLDRRRQNLIHVFEYMIGNTEYSFVNPEPDKDCCHNMDMLSSTGEPPYLPLPFDYDFSGMVNAPYAQPNPRYPIRTVTLRYYKGVCANNDILPDTLALFLSRRGDMERVVGEAGFLSVRSRRSLRQYLNAFFGKISRPARVRRDLIERCNAQENSYGLTPEAPP